VVPDTSEIQFRAVFSRAFWQNKTVPILSLCRQLPEAGTAILHKTGARMKKLWPAVNATKTGFIKFRTGFGLPAQMSFLTQSVLPAKRTFDEAGDRCNPDTMSGPFGW